MTIAVFAPRDAAFARRLTARVAALSDQPARLFPVDPDGEVPAALNGSELSWGGEPLGQASTVFISGFRYEDPVLPPADDAVDWSFWQCRHVLRQQSYSFCWSFFSRLEATGAALYNPPSALLKLFARSQPLDALRAAGLTTPAVTLTNDPVLAEEAQQRHPAVVWRPATGRAAWQLFRDKQRRHLVGADKPPVLLAPAQAGMLLRVYVIDGQIALAFTAAPPAREDVERFELTRCVDPAAIPGLDRLAAAAQVLGLRWAAFTVVSGEQDVTVYDVDADPVVGDLPPSLQGHLAEALACALTGRPLPAAPAEGLAPRDTLLLRRMLVIQFEMEATKHAAG